MQKPTTWQRATVDEMGRLILPPEPLVRHVRLIVPDNPFVEIALFASEEDLGKVLSPEGKILDLDVFSQDALSPLLPPDVTIPLIVGPGQAMIGRAREGLAELSVIVEYP